MADSSALLLDRTTPAAQGALPVGPGAIIGGRYRVGEVIGEGGMGIVLEAVHLGLEAPVAVKIIRSDLMQDQEFVLRFTNEARAAALLKGEHIARVYDVGRLETGEPYLVMERLEGVGLESFLASVGPLDAATAVGLVLEVCEGLAEAHALSLVHRDIKPANLFLSRRPDGRSVVKILDFGIAKRLADKKRRSLTNPARSLGSPWYMSPEQMLDPSRVDVRSDIWSLGVLLFELLTNDHPFDGDGVPEVCAKVLNAPSPSLESFRSDIDPALDAIVRRCLEKDPTERFANVQELEAALLEFAPESVSATAFSVPRSGRRRRSSRPTLGSLAPFARRPHRRLGWSGAFAVASIVIAAGALAWGAYANRTGLPIPAMSRADLERAFERARLPGDPALAPGPEASPLVGPDALVEAPRLVSAAPEASVATTRRALADSTGASDDPPLTEAEIERRAARYESWLRTQGLKRPGDETVDLVNPY